MHDRRRGNANGRGRRFKKLTDTLIWQLDWGEQGAAIKAAALESGTELPALPFLQTEPELAPHLEFEWRAFRDLSTDRHTGFDVGPIPWTSIDRYARRYRIDGPDEFDRFCRLISDLDAAYRSHHEEKQRQAKSK